MDTIPAVCRPLQTDLDDAKDELAGFVFPVGGTTEQKEDAKAEKGRLQSKVNDLEKRLQDCINNPPAPKPDPPPPPPKPNLDVRIEVVQCVQRASNTVLLIAGKRTVVRAFVSSGVTSGHDEGAGPNRWPNVTGRLTVTDLASGTVLVSNLPPFNPGGTITAQPGGGDRSNGSHSLNFRLPLSVVGRLLPVRLTVQAFVQGHETGPEGFTTSSEILVAFVPRPPQRVQPILVADGFGGVPAPSISTFATDLFTGVLPRYPLSTFIVSRPIPFTMITPLTFLPGWFLLLARIAALGAIAPQFEGIRCALVPAAPAGTTYPTGGVGIPRVWPFVQASFVVAAGLPNTFAHEMGHTYGVGHSICRGNEPWPTDDRLGPWGATDQPGWDTTPGTDSAVPVGTGDLMSYCPNPRWPSLRLYGILRDAGPV